MKNEINLQRYYFTWELEHEIARFVEYYNNERHHESLNNVTPADVYYGKHQEVITRRERIRRKTLKARRRCNLAGPTTRQITNQPLRSSLGSNLNLSGTL